jgi:hypothetical protein
MLLEEFLMPMNLTQRELAEAIHVPCEISELQTRQWVPYPKIEDVKALPNHRLLVR